ncbi:hypothetical protein [Synechococcus sp. PCC 6312]|uniref:hypothetical protein n=1 Tax=Synechococcus sp. (strain ATCC 27167 / PCC 6312) TaxID=195253 RepID=UPI00029EF183|nr:hypothetical protein [Synechococcus sp. PCC 6312]AFY61796.1 hypothetical protein Syn6312_2710 [Synechococcus sp. PCC 6312]
MKLQDILNDNLVLTLEQLQEDTELLKQIETRLSELNLIDVSTVNGVWKTATETALSSFCDSAFLNNMTTKLFGRTFAKKLLEISAPLSIPQPIASINLNLSGSVGRGGDNINRDVAAVKNRLCDLGFSWIGRNGTMDEETIRTIELFQAIIDGKVNVLGVDGRIDVNGKTKKYLESAKAPRWQEMPRGSSREGFINFDNMQGDTHDFGTSWMVEVIQESARIYTTSHRNSNPNSALIVTNNLSVARGGDTPIHATHETGLSCDILLPKKNGTFGGITFRSIEYDQAAMEAMLRAIRKQNKYRINRIFFNDFSLVAKGLCQNLNDGGVHDNHAHIDILPPQF